MAGAIGFGELADFDEALGYGAGCGLFAGRGCDERGGVSKVAVGGEGKREGEVRHAAATRLESTVSS